MILVFIAGFLLGGMVVTAGVLAIAKRRKVDWLLFPGCFEWPEDGFNFLEE